MPNVEIKRKLRLTRQQVADRLIALGNAMAAGAEIELGSGGDSIKIGIAGEVEWEFEIEIDGDETELEIEIKWKDDPVGGSSAAPGTAEPGPTPLVAEHVPAPARRGRPRKTAAG
ncbi:MAG TPA: amphi-Trp domain-containing protein [Nakamurella sp.]